jgi:hypothetical protein
LPTTPAVQVPVGDAMTGAADWRDAHHYHLFMVSTTDRWIRFAGALGKEGFTIDTLGSALPSP